MNNESPKKLSLQDLNPGSNKNSFAIQIVDSDGNFFDN